MTLKRSEVLKRRKRMERDYNYGWRDGFRAGQLCKAAEKAEGKQ